MARGRVASRRSAWRRGWRDAPGQCPGTSHGPACLPSRDGPPRAPMPTPTSRGQSRWAGGPRRWCTSSPRRPSQRTTRTRTPRSWAAAGSSGRRGEWGCPHGRGGGGGGPPRADISKKRRAPRGGGGGTSWGGRKNGSADTASQPARRVTSRGVGEESRRHTWWESETGVCVWAHEEGSGLRASRGCGGRETPERAGHNATWGWGEPDPVRGPTSTTPLGRGSGGGWEWSWPAPCQGAGPDPPPRGRRGTGGDATSRDEGAV